MGKFKLKATVTDKSRSIIVSFHSRWDGALRAKRVPSDVDRFSKF